MTTASRYSSRLRGLIGFWLLLGVTLWVGVPAGLGPRPAWAKAPNDFKEHVDRAGKLYAEGDFEGSLKELHAAYAIRQVPILVLNIGQAYRKLGRSKEALAFYELYLRIESSPKPEIRTELERFIAQTRAMLDAAEKMKSIGSGTDSGTFAQPSPQQGPGPVAPPGPGPVAPPGPGPVAPPEPAIEPAPLPLLPAPPPQTVDLRLRAGMTPAPVADTGHRPIYKRWWFWGTIGLVVAGAVVAGVVVATLPPADPKGLVIMDQRF